jgi:hypothetical protein
MGVRFRTVFVHLGYRKWLDSSRYGNFPNCFTKYWLSEEFSPQRQLEEHIL